METTKNDLAEAEKKLLEADDRGVFGTEGMKNISASVRQRFRRALEPRSATAWKKIGRASCRESVMGRAGERSRKRK